MPEGLIAPMSHTLIAPEVSETANTNSNSSSSSTTALEYTSDGNYYMYLGPVYMGTPVQSM